MKNTQNTSDRPESSNDQAELRQTSGANQPTAEAAKVDAAPAVGSGALLDDATRSDQTTKTHQCRCPVKPVSVLTLLKLRFLSYSDLMAHLEQYPASVEIVERMIHRCLPLKPLLSQWIQDGRPETDWPENDNLQKDPRSPKEKQRALRESYMAFE